MLRKKFFENILDNIDQQDYRPSDRELKQLFDLFNAKYFKGDLPNCKCFNNRLSNNELGCFYFNPIVVKARVDGIRVIDENVLKSIGICINNSVAFTKRQLCECLIHEMVHLYQFVEHPSSIFIDGGHEQFFLEKANHITAVSEFNITTTCDQKLGDRNINDIYSIITNNPILCLLYKTTDGKELPFGVASIPYDFIDNISAIILSSGKYSKVEFFECKNKKLLNKIDSIFGTNKESAIIKALKVMNTPEQVSTKDFVCASWYDVDRSFDFENDTRFIVGVNKNGKVFNTRTKLKESKRRLKQSILEKLDEDIIDIKLSLLQSGDNKLTIEDIEEIDDGEYSVLAKLV